MCTAIVLRKSCVISCNFVEFDTREIQRTQLEMARSGLCVEEAFKNARVDEKLLRFKTSLKPLPPGNTVADKTARKKRKVELKQFKKKLREPLNDLMREKFMNQRHPPILNTGGPTSYAIDSLHLRLRVVEFFETLIEREILLHPDPDEVRKLYQENLQRFGVHHRVTGLIGSEASKLVNECHEILAPLRQSSKLKLFGIFQRFRVILLYFSSSRYFSEPEALCYRKLCLEFGQFLNKSFRLARGVRICIYTLWCTTVGIFYTSSTI